MAREAAMAGEPDAPAAGANAKGSVPASSNDSVDRSVLQSLRDLQEEGEPDILAELIALFLDDAPTRLRGIREAAANGDANFLERNAHTLKGSSQNMGATRMGALCAQLQEAGRTGDLSRVPELVDLITDEFERVDAELTAEMAQ